MNKWQHQVRLKWEFERGDLHPAMSSNPKNLLGRARHCGPGPDVLDHGITDDEIVTLRRNFLHVARIAQDHSKVLEARLFEFSRVVR
jgi:hypothetical protein